MTGRQRLHPEAVFALNRVLGQELEAYLYRECVPLDRPLVVPSRFSKSSRTFRWLAVDDEHGFRPDDIMTASRNLATSWEAFCNEVDTRGSRRARASLTRVQQFIASGPASQTTSDALRRDLLILYESYRLPADLYLDGIVYRSLAQLHGTSDDHSARITHVTGELLRDRPETFNNYPWIKATFWDEQEDLKLPPYHCQEASLLGLRNANEIHRPDSLGRPASDFAAKLLECVFFLGSQARHSHFLLVPLYDTVLANKPAGGVWGSVLLFFERADKLNSFVSSLLEELRKYSPRLVHQFTGAAWSAILAEPLAPGANLVDHFLKHLTRLQDWESVTVYGRIGSGYEPRYCYRRQADWRSCQDLGSGQPCPQCLSWQSAMDQAEAGTYVVWEVKDIWDDGLLTEIRDTEGLGLEGSAFAFQYPVSAVIPSEAGRRDMLRDMYVLQQLDLLRDLAPRVVARRSATRSAATAIMSRNLSHNLGSHVLSSLGVEDSIRRVRPPQHARFYAYLRSRMDFLATVMTARTGAAVPLMLYRDVMAAFRPDPHDKALATYGQKLLLDRISAIRSLDADHIHLDVRNGGLPVTLSDADRDRDALFASPEGVMGAQALYAILENVIRNSAKFARPTPSQITLTLTLEDFIPLDGSPMYEVTLSDGLRTANPSVVKKLKTEMDASILAAAGAPRRGSWGLAEIKCCAAFLRGVPIEEVDRKHNPPLVTPILADEQAQETTSDGGSLAYRFYLNRPREVAIVCPTVRWPAEETRNRLRHLGIDFIDPVAITDPRGFAHRLMVWYGHDAMPTVYRQVRSSLPLRLLVPTAWSAADAAAADEDFLSTVEALLASDVGAAVEALDKAWLLHVTSWTSGEPTPELCRTGGGALGVGRFLNLEDTLHRGMVVYDRHGSLYPAIDRLPGECRPRFWEPYQQGEPVYPYVEHGVALLPDVYRRLKRDLTEAAVVRVVVADERVQKAIYGKDPAMWRYGETGEISMSTILPMMGIEVPDPTGDLDLDTPERLSLESWLTQHAAGCVLVIHQNLLDKLDRAGDEASRWLATAVNRAGIRHTVVDSGRGVPFKNIDWARFVRLSDLLDWTIGNKSKYHLVQTLLASRSA